MKQKKWQRESDAVIIHTRKTARKNILETKKRARASEAQCGTGKNERAVEDTFKVGSREGARGDGTLGECGEESAMERNFWCSPVKHVTIKKATGGENNYRHLGKTQPLSGSSKQSTCAHMWETTTLNTFNSTTPVAHTGSSPTRQRQKMRREETLMSGAPPMLIFILMKIVTGLKNRHAEVASTGNL